MKKSLPMEGDAILARLAELALFERVQDMFNLHPGQLVQSIRWLANQERLTPYELVERLRTLIPLEFDFVLKGVHDHLSGRSANFRVSKRLYAYRIRVKFNLDPGEMIRDYPKKAESIGMEKLQIIYAIRKVVPRVIEWTLDEVVKILKKQDAVK